MDGRTRSLKSVPRLRYTVGSLLASGRVRTRRVMLTICRSREPECDEIWCARARTS